MTNSERLFEAAKKVMPGGVNSPVRAFGSIGSTPRFVARADGSHMWDEDGTEYIDFIGSWGPMILGHNYPAVRENVQKACENGLSYGTATAIEVKMAELVCSLVPSVEMIRMVNSGTEAVMSAVRAARGFTGRDKIVKFAGCYHGHSDGLLVAAGSGVMTAGIPDSLGVPSAMTKDTLGAEYNNIDSVRMCFEKFPKEIAAVIVEPVAANMGVVLPEKGFLEGLRELCSEYGALLIFDEVITGFRLSLGGAQEYFGIKPDLTTFGKIIGAGMPVGAYGGRREIMEMVAPLGKVYQAGTLSGNPLAMTAGYTQLSVLRDNPQYYTELNRRADKFFGDIETLLKERHLPCRVNHIGSLGSIFFTDSPVRDYASAKKSDTKAFGIYCNKMFDRHIYVAPSQFEAMFISMAHTEEDLKQALHAMEESLPDHHIQEKS